MDLAVACFRENYVLQSMYSILFADRLDIQSPTQSFLELLERDIRRNLDYGIFHRIA